MTFKIHTHTDTKHSHTHTRAHTLHLARQMGFFISRLFIKLIKKIFITNSADNCFGMMLNNLRSSLFYFFHSSHVSHLTCSPIARNAYDTMRCVVEKVKKSYVKCTKHTNHFHEHFFALFKNTTYFLHTRTSIAKYSKHNGIDSTQGINLRIFVVRRYFFFHRCFFHWHQVSTTYHNSHPINAFHTIFEAVLLFSQFQSNLLFQLMFSFCSSLIPFPDYKLFPVLPSNEREIIAFFNSCQTHCLFHDKEISLLLLLFSVLLLRSLRCVFYFTVAFFLVTIGIFMHANDFSVQNVCFISLPSILHRKSINHGCKFQPERKWRRNKNKSDHFCYTLH